MSETTTWVRQLTAEKPPRIKTNLHAADATRETNDTADCCVFTMEILQPNERRCEVRKRH